METKGSHRGGEAQWPKLVVEDQNSHIRNERRAGGDAESGRDNQDRKHGRGPGRGPIRGREPRKVQQWTKFEERGGVTIGG